MDIPFSAEGAAVIDETTAKKLEQKLMNNMLWAETAEGLALEWRKSEISGGSGQQPRVIHSFGIGMSNAYKEKHDGFGGSFKFGALPDFLRDSAKPLTGSNVYRWFNRQRRAELPYLEIGFNPQTREITSIWVYEKVEIPESGIHRQ